MRSKSINGKSFEEIKKAYENSILDGFKPTLAFVFSSINQDWKGLSQFFDSENLSVFGMTSCGEFTDQGITDQENAILLVDLNPNYFKIYIKENSKEPQRETAKAIGQEIASDFDNPGLILASSNFMRAGEDIVWGLEDAIGEENLVVFGGRAGDDNQLKGTFVFSNGQVTNDGLIVLAINRDRVQMEGVAISGWKSVGTHHTITEREGNWIKTIDEQPALDMILKYTGINLDFSKESDIFQKIGYPFPLLIEREKGQPIATPMMMANKEDKSVLIATGLEHNVERFRFAVPPDFDVVDTVVNSSRNMVEKLPDVDAMLIFSCAARKEVLGPLLESEINGLTETWGSNMAGTFCYGEFGRPPGGDVEFLGTTCSWVALKEKE
jgi:hypothetical protein